MKRPASEIRPSEVQQRFTAALNLYVGYERRFSIAEIAGLTGISQRTLRSYQAGDACPSLPKFLRLAAVLPPEFADMAMAPAGLTGLRSSATGKTSVVDLNRHLTSAVAEIGAVIGQNGINDVRTRQLIPALWALRVAIDTWLAGHGGDR